MRKQNDDSIFAADSVESLDVYFEPDAAIGVDGSFVFDDCDCDDCAPCVDGDDFADCADCVDVPDEPPLPPETTDICERGAAL